MENQTPVAYNHVPPEIWIKIFELLNPLEPDYTKNSYSNDILNCNNVCLTFHNILNPTFTSWLLPQVLPFIHPFITNNSIKPILNCRLVCKAWKQGVDHFLESHDIFTRKQLEDGQVNPNHLNTSLPNKSIPMTCLFTKQDVTIFVREMDNGTGSPFIGNSLLLRFNHLDHQNMSTYISISSALQLLIRFGRHIKVLYLYILQYQWNASHGTLYNQIRSILEYTPNLRRLSIQGYLNSRTTTSENIEIENLDDMIVDREVETLKLHNLESIGIDIGGQHCLSLKLAIYLGLTCSTSFSQLKRLSLVNNLHTNFYPHFRTDLLKWSRVWGCLPNLEQLEVRILAISNLFEIFHLASKSHKLSSLTIKISTHSWKDHVKYFSKYYPYSVNPVYRSMCADEHNREYYYFLNYRLELGNLLRKVQKVFWKSLETLVIVVEEVARKHCKANSNDLEILAGMPHLSNLHIEGFPLCKLELVGKLPGTLKSLGLSGYLPLPDFHFGDDDYGTNEFKIMPGVSSDLKDGWSIYQNKLWEQLPDLRWVNVVLWDYKKDDNTSFIYRREKRDWLLTRKEEQEKYLVVERTCWENTSCCSLV